MSELQLTDYFVSRVYSIEDFCKFSISYHMAEDKAYHEILQSPTKQIDIKQAQELVPELIEERWVYVLNKGEYLMLDRYEKDIVSSAYLFDKDGNPIVDDENLIQHAASVIAVVIKDEVEKLQKILDDALHN